MLAFLRLNRPDKLNALNVQMVEELWNALDVLVKSVRAVISIGAERAFCSGAALGGRCGRSADEPWTAVLGFCRRRRAQYPPPFKAGLEAN
jgi:enoyl-CoA hydratase/carnithine racemase